MERLRNNCFAVYKSVEFIFLRHNYLCYETSACTLFASLTSNYEYAQKWHFEKDKYDCFELPITPDQLDSAYEVENHCIYKGKEFETVCFREDLQAFGFDLRGTDRATAKMFGLTDEVLDEYYGSNGFFDMRMGAHIPDNEILDVWEIRKPIEGFPFKGPEKVWVKKDGVWLR